MSAPPELDDLLHRPTQAATGAVLRDSATTPVVPPPPPAAPSRRFGAVELEPGSQLGDGRFTVRQVLGRGGFGITYACDDQRLRRQVAVKELAPAHRVEAFDDAKERFLREATVLARFSDPGIVRVYEVFEERETAYLVMELVQGRTLHEVVAEHGPLGEREVLHVAECCGSALAVVHRAGVLHRDLNPANVVVAGDGRVVVIDFGLAREFAADHTGAMTRVVTPGYAPPEQYGGVARFGPPTDVYGLAATLYFLLTGVAPASAVDRQTGTQLVPPHRHNPRTSAMVSAAVMDGLELQCGHRPATMGAFLSRLGIAARTPAPAPTPAPDPAPAPAPAPAPPPSFNGSPYPYPSPYPAPYAMPVAPVYYAPPVGPPLGGPARPGRWLVDAPLLAAIAALASAAPAVIAPVLAFIALPAVATAGDAIVFARLRRQGARLRWLHRIALPAYVPIRFVRNVADVAYRGVPALVLAAAAIALALLFDAGGLGHAARELVVRPAGAGVALLLIIPVFRDRVRFRAAVVADIVYDRLLDPTGRYTSTGLGVAIGAVALVAVGLAFRPELWPV